jgi:hypothetical protein
MTGHAIGAPRSGRARWWGLAGFVATFTSALNAAIWLAN